MAVDGREAGSLVWSPLSDGEAKAMAWLMGGEERREA